MGSPGVEGRFPPKRVRGPLELRRRHKVGPSKYETRSGETDWGVSGLGESTDVSVVRVTPSTLQ